MLLDGSFDLFRLITCCAAFMREFAQCRSQIAGGAFKTVCTGFEFFYIRSGAHGNRRTSAFDLRSQTLSRRFSLLLGSRHLYL